MNLPFKLVVLAVAAVTVVSCAKKAPSGPVFPKRLVTATIILYQQPGTGCVARTAPQRVLASRFLDDIEWTVVNLCNVDTSTLEIVFPPADSPLQPMASDKESRMPIGPVGRLRRSFRLTAAVKVYKYQIFLNGTMIEDPELEIMN